MSSSAVDLKVRLTGDPAALLDSLEKSRASMLRFYGDTRKGADEAKQAWAKAQENIRKLAVEMRGAEAPAASQRAAFDAAVKKADELKTAYLGLRDAAHQQQQKLKENATAIDTARTAHAAMDQQSKALGARWAAMREQSRGLTTETMTLGDAMRTLTVAAGTAVGVGSLREIAGLVDKYAALNSRIKLSVSTNDEFIASQLGVQRIANESGQELNAVGSLYVRTSGAVRQYGMAQETALKVTDLVGKSIRLSGATAQESASANLQFAQALGAGTLRGEELNAVLEAAPRLAQALADGLGVPQTKLKQLGEQGALTSQQIINALLSQEARLNSEVAQTPLRLSEAWNTLGNSVQVYVGKADAASGASAALARGIQHVATNVDIVVPSVAALGAGLTAVAATSAVRALAGVALATGPVGITLGIATAATVGLMAALSNGTGRVIPAAEKALKDLNAEVRDFSDRMSDAERAQKATELEAAVERLRNAFSQMSRETPNAPILKRWMDEISRAENALERLQTKTAKPLPYTMEKSALGLGGLAPSRGQLIDKKQAEALEAFDKSYAAFVERTVDGEGKLVFSYGQIKAALDNLLSSAKSPAELNALIASLEAAQKKGGSAALDGAMSMAVEARAAAETKALDARVARMRAEAEKTASAFVATAANARVAMQIATGMARVTAELRGDTGALAAEQAAGFRADSVVIASQAKVEINMAEQIAAKKRASIIALRDAEIAAAKDVESKTTQAEGKRLELIQKQRADLEAQRQAILSSPAGLAPKGSSQADEAQAQLDKLAAQDRNLATQQARLLDGALERRKRNADEAVRVEATAGRQIADVEKETAQRRLDILNDAQGKIVSKANEALNAYKGYAQQVIQLDREINSNRLNTAGSIESLKRRDMTPKQQADSLRNEMNGLKEKEREAADSGDREQQLSILGRQRNVANELANVQGEGVNPQELRSEAIDNLQRIGGESDSILKGQRAEAAAAAEQQKAAYEALVTNLQRLSAEMSKLSQGEAIKLRAEIDTASVQAAVSAVREAFAKETFAIRVAAQSGASGPAQPATSGADPISRATGGPVAGPGTGTSDSIPALLSNGEHVLTAAEVSAAGGHGAIYALRAAMRRGYVPRFADGGAVGASAVAGLVIPAPVRERAAAPLQPMNMTLPGIGTFPVQASQDVARAMDEKFRMESLKRGRAR